MLIDSARIIYRRRASMLSQNQHGIAIAVKSIALLDGFGICFTDQLQAGKSGDD
jgi:hypothetical protein